MSSWAGKKIFIKHVVKSKILCSLATDIASAGAGFYFKDYYLQLG